MYINHLIIREVIPMLSAIKILLVCFLNNETVSAYMKVKGVILQLTLGKLNFGGLISSDLSNSSRFYSEEPEERW